MQAGSGASKPQLEPALRNDRDVADRFHGLSKAHLVEAYRLMLLSRKIDDREIQLKRQNKVYFQINGVGHEAVLVAAAMHLRPGRDWCFPYYRDRALALALGMTAFEQLLASVGAGADPASGGRQMPSHWGHKNLNIVAQSSCVATQFLHAVGAAIAGDRSRRMRPTTSCTFREATGRPAKASSGSRSTTPAFTRCRSSILIEDNNYAISVPVEKQTAGGSISRLVRSFPDLFVTEFDGLQFHRELLPAEGRRGLSARGKRSRARARSRCPALLSLPLGRRATLQNGERARGGSEARSGDAHAAPAPRGGAHRREDSGRARGSRAPGGRRSGGPGALHELADEGELERAHVQPHRGSDGERVRKTRSRSPHGCTACTRRTTMVDLLNACLRDEMRRDPRIVDLRTGRRRREPGGEPRRGQGQGRCLQSDARDCSGSSVASRVWNSTLAEASIVGLADRRRGSRIEAGGRDPVPRLHLARVHADSERARDVPLALERSFQRPVGDPGSRRRVPSRRSHLPQPVR